MRSAMPEHAGAHLWSEEDRALVQDRLDTLFTGSPRRVADRLEQLRQLQQATGADELLITTITRPRGPGPLVGVLRRGHASVPG